MKENKNLSVELSQFHGTENYYRHPFGKIMYTDGIQYLAEQAQCYWLIDLVASYQVEERVMNEPFQVYTLKVHDDRTALVTIDDGNENILATQELEYTDFPLKEIVIWLVDNILILPSEY